MIVKVLNYYYYYYVVSNHIKQKIIIIMEGVVLCFVYLATNKLNI